MRTLKMAILFILLGNVIQSTAQSDSIFAVVSGDTVTLWQTGVWRNCGAAYLMEIEQSDYDLIWYQLDTGDAAYCMCYFDLSVSFRLSEPGIYHADIYYTESVSPENPIYQGMVNFVIGNVKTPGRSGIIGQYQSDCYSNIGMLERSISEHVFNLYPMPVRDGQLLHLEANPAGEEAILEIYTLTGKLLYSKHYDENRPIQDRWMKDELFPVSGLYLVRLRTPDQIYVRKIYVH